jgi:hypothetical protein
VLRTNQSTATLKSHDTTRHPRLVKSTKCSLTGTVPSSIAVIAEDPHREREPEMFPVSNSDCRNHTFGHISPTARISPRNQQIMLLQISDKLLEDRYDYLVFVNRHAAYSGFSVVLAGMQLPLWILPACLTLAKEGTLFLA